LEGSRGEKLAVTGDDGSYRFALLIPGAYKVTAELEGFAEAKAAAQVTAGGLSTADLQLRLETAELITVTAEAPLVDKYSVTAGATVTAEVGVAATGENRTYYGVVNMLPGVSSDPENGDIQGTRPNVNGGHFADSGVFIDGVDTTFARFGGSRVFLPTTATTEITMEAGGSSAEYGRFVASATNVIVKSGTNQFHLNALGSYQPTEWASDYDSHVELTQIEFSPVPADFLKRQPAEEETEATGYEASLGGPIKRDKAWFFLGLANFSTNDLDKTLNGDLVDTSLESESFIGKLNFQPGANHQLAASWIDTPARRIYFHPPSGDQYTPTPHEVPGELGSLNWNYSISSKLFLETKLATQTSDENKFLAVGEANITHNGPIADVTADAVRIKQQDPRFPANPNGGPHWPGNNYSVYVDSFDDDSWHNGWLLDNGFGLNEYPREQANAALTYFAGADHELKFGIDYQDVRWESNVRKTNVYSGPRFNALSPSGYDDCGLVRGLICFYADYNPPDLLAQGNEVRSIHETTALFARDRFSVGDHWVFNLGVRAEQMENRNDIDRKVVDETVFAPRFSGTYDVKGDGRMLFNLSAGRHYAQLNQQLTNQWLMETWTGYYGQDNYLWCDQLDVIVNTVVAPGALPGCNSIGYNYTLRSQRPGQMWDLVDSGVIDVDLKPFYKDEIILGWEWQFTNNWAVDVKGIAWELGDMISNTIQRAPNGEFFELTVNFDQFRQVLRNIGQVPEPLIDAFEDGKKEYQALQLQLNRRFNNGWAVYNNLTFADTETTGSGAWWNNWNSTYGYDLGSVLTEADIRACELAQLGFTDGNPPVQVSAGRTVPVDCRTALTPFLGQSSSTINRVGKDGVASSRYDEGGVGADREWIFKSFGYKVWTFGKQDINLGGLLMAQAGSPWGRVEQVSVAPTAGDTAALLIGTNGLDVVVEPNGTRKLDSHWMLNLGASWGFPLGNKLRGEVRVEGTNVTDNQEQILISDRGEVRRVRREFQRPRQFRLLASVKF
jgi:hypothetical protein